MTNAQSLFRLSKGISCVCVWLPHRRPALRSAAILLVLAGVVFSHPNLSIASENGTAEIGTPSSESAADDGRGARRYLVWPLVFVEEAPSWKQFSLIPIYVDREATDASERRIQILWPLFLYRRFDQDIKIQFFPFFYYWRDVFSYEKGEERDFDYMVLPFVFGGASSEGETYFALFPLLGTLKEYLGRDEIRFVLFPLYMDYSKNEMHQRNFIWPILSFSEGGGYNGFRFWPFYGRFEKTGEYANKFVLWPFYHNQTFDLDKEQSGRRTLILPLYGMEESRRRSYRSVIWPLFSHEKNYVQNFEQRSVPWPFVVIARGDVHNTQVWPFYGYRQTSDSTNKFVLWPFWRHREFELDENTRKRELFLVPFLSRIQTCGPEGIREQKLRFWPLWRHRLFEDGSTELNVLSLLWFDDERGFERQYSPLWTLYKRRSIGDGSRDIRALWGLIHHEHTPSRSKTHVPLFFSRTRDAERDVRETEILKGLFAVRNEAGERDVRLLYVIHVP